MVQNNQKEPQRQWLPILCIADTAMIFASGVFLVGTLFTTGLLPTIYLVLLTGVLCLLCAGTFFLTKNTIKIGRMVAGTILSVVVTIGCILTGFYIGKTVDAIRSVADTAVEKTAVTFFTLSDNPAQSIEEMQGERVGILSELDRASTDEMVRALQEENGLSFSLREYDSLMELADGLLDQEVSGIILNAAYIDLYEEVPGYEDFSTQIRALTTHELEHEVEAPAEAAEEETEDPVINILISGSDTRENTIDQRGRSDVNIIVSLNRETHQILLLSTPRDYFVPLDIWVDDAYDKLTHAGIYGMDVLMGTLENLYGIDLDYYFRINFTGFVDVVDALGGIDVYSDYEFDSRGEHFTYGMNHMTGEEALIFARERYSFETGDRQRGINQMKVLEAVLNKAMSPSILRGYLPILESVQSYVDTSVPYSLIADLVRQQLDEGATWSIETFSVNGSDAKATTYSMSPELYVMIPDEATVQQAQEKLQAIGNEIDLPQESAEAESTETEPDNEAAA